MRILSSLAVLTVSVAAASPASAAPALSLGGVFGDAALPIKALMVGLMVSVVVAVIITLGKLRTSQLSGGSAFVSGLRLGGPLIGLLGASLNALWSFMAIASRGETPPLPVVAPGLAEAALVLSLGLIAGVVAVICHCVIEARIDRAVLRA